ncbi:IS256 family transposase [Parageobacillus thermantarcticus]|uniref:IS256 family transposase n=1 Tax=Parageobacillus thermantarcticus TaxID=186116 RepID=UPI00244CC0F6|nr:IS256 family transposase [Parageobacillus thermantarcticus]
MPEQVLHQILEAQVEEQLGARRDERTEERKGYRNGSYPRQLTTRVGRLTLRVPRTRDGEFSTELFQRYQRSEQALVLALMEMVVNGVSTRKITPITEELCGTSFSKSTVSSLCKGWIRLSKTGTIVPCMNTCIRLYWWRRFSKVREDGRVRSRAVLIATGVNEEGYREILGLQIGNSESESSWSEFFGWLKDRGLRGVDLIISDQHGGLMQAIEKHFQGATWQRCQTHFIRNILDAAPKYMQDALLEEIRGILHAPNKQTARLLLEQVLAKWRDGRQKPCKSLRKDLKTPPLY